MIDNRQIEMGDDGQPVHFFSLAEAGIFFGVTYQTILRWVRTGTLPSVRLGGTWRVSNRTLEAAGAGLPLWVASRAWVIVNSNKAAKSKGGVVLIRTKPADLLLEPIFEIVPWYSPLRAYRVRSPLTKDLPEGAFLTEDSSRVSAWKGNPGKYLFSLEFHKSWRSIYSIETGVSSGSVVVILQPLE